MGLKLKIDDAGYTDFIDREALAMDPHQLDRELVHNGGEAGGQVVYIDGWTDPTSGQVCKRITDNGTGMTQSQLINHLRTMHLTGKKRGQNFGIGARLAGLPRNPAGMTYASRTGDGDWVITLWKRNGNYEIAEWDLGDGDAHHIVNATSSELDRLDKLSPNTTGTAVILSGDGKDDTWTSAETHATRKWLSQRYYRFPGNAKVYVNDPSVAGGGQRVRTFSDTVFKQAVEFGLVNIAADAYTAAVHWWILEADDENRARWDYPASGGVGFLVDDEIFAYQLDRAFDFGVWLKSVARRVVLLVEVDGATMNHARTRPVLPGGVDAMPWKVLGKAFADNLPDPIARLLEEAHRRAAAIRDESWAEKLDAAWFKKIKPTLELVAEPAGTDTTGDEGGLGGGAPGDTPDPTDGGTTSASSPAKRRPPSAGDTAPATRKPRSTIPDVQFVASDEIFDDHYVEYSEGTNLVKVSIESPGYVALVMDTVDTFALQHIRAEPAVQYALRAELASVIIHANMHRDVGHDPSWCAEQRSNAVLYGRLLGLQAIREAIRAYIAEVNVNAG